LARLDIDFLFNKFGRKVNSIGRQVRVLVEEGVFRLGLSNMTKDYKRLVKREPIYNNHLPCNLSGKLCKIYFHSYQQDSILTLVRLFNPEFDHQIMSEADRICNHIFDLLGSGPTHLGEKIDWHIDFKTGYKWNPKTYFKRIQPAPYPGGYDIKVPWELNRCQQFVRLGQAYWITGNEKYAQEFMAQVEDWIASNPWPWGVNWNCTMDVAIRTVNWLWGYTFFQESPVLSDGFRLTIFKSLLNHGIHIFHNLENRVRTTGNHYISNLVGLLYLGILCPFFGDAQKWREFSMRELEKEMFKQVYPDGVDYEASTSYHRLVLELFLSATSLAICNGYTFSQSYMDRLEKMVEFIMYITAPDGTVPLIGDNDNGRLHRFKVWEPPEREWVDFRYLLAIGALLYRRDDFAKAAGDQWEDAVWLFGEEVLEFIKVEGAYEPHHNQLQSRAFTNAGIYIMRENDFYLLVDSGTTGRNGVGGHAHNDSLSIFLQTGGYSWFIDPGTYVYTADYHARNLFRSTDYHNGVTIAGLEQNNIIVDKLFRLPNDSPPSVHAWQDCFDYSFFDGSYQLSNRGLLVRHQRQILLDKLSRVAMVRDNIQGEGRYNLVWHWRLSPSLELRSDSKWLLTCRRDENFLHVVCFSGTHEPTSFSKEGWVSPGYGLRKQSTVLNSVLDVDLPVVVTWALVPSDHQYEDITERIQLAWKCFESFLFESQKKIYDKRYYDQCNEN
jgi:hypothetical protein